MGCNVYNLEGQVLVKVYNGGNVFSTCPQRFLLIKHAQNSLRLCWAVFTEFYTVDTFSPYLPVLWDFSSSVWPTLSECESCGKCKFNKSWLADSEREEQHKGNWGPVIIRSHWYCVSAPSPTFFSKLTVLQSTFTQNQQPGPIDSRFFYSSHA